MWTTQSRSSNGPAKNIKCLVGSLKNRWQWPESDVLKWVPDTLPCLSPIQKKIGVAWILRFGQVDTQKILHRVLQKVRSITLIRFYTLWNCQQYLSVEGDYGNCNHKKV